MCRQRKLYAFNWESRQERGVTCAEGSRVERKEAGDLTANTEFTAWASISVQPCEAAAIIISTLEIRKSGSQDHISRKYRARTQNQQPGRRLSTFNCLSRAERDDDQHEEVSS